MEVDEKRAERFSGHEGPAHFFQSAGAFQSQFTFAAHVRCIILRSRCCPGPPYARWFGASYRLRVTIVNVISEQLLEGCPETPRHVHKVQIFLSMVGCKPDSRSVYIAISIYTLHAYTEVTSHSLSQCLGSITISG